MFQIILGGKKLPPFLFTTMIAWECRFSFFQRTIPTKRTKKGKREERAAKSEEREEHCEKR